MSGDTIQAARVTCVNELVAQIDDLKGEPHACGHHALFERLKVKILQLSMNLDFCVEDIKEARLTNQNLERALNRERGERRNLAEQLSHYMRLENHSDPRNET